MEILRNVAEGEDISDVIALNDGSEEPIQPRTDEPLEVLTMKMRVAVLVFKKSDVSLWHARIIARVSSDDGVRESFGKKGQLHYDGCEAGYSTAERVYCALTVYFEVTYDLNPAKIETTYRRYQILDAIAAALETIDATE